jgi:hypothetical protein
LTAGRARQGATDERNLAFRTARPNIVTQDHRETTGKADHFDQKQERRTCDKRFATALCLRVIIASATMTQ